MQLTINNHMYTFQFRSIQSTFSCGYLYQSTLLFPDLDIFSTTGINVLQRQVVNIEMLFTASASVCCHCVPYIFLEGGRMFLGETFDPSVPWSLLPISSSMFTIYVWSLILSYRYKSKSTFGFQGNNSKIRGYFLALC